MKGMITIINKVLGIFLFAIMVVSSTSIAFAIDNADEHSNTTDDKYTIKYMASCHKSIELIYEDGQRINGHKPDNSGQMLDAAGFNTNMPDGSTMISFCADLGANQVWGDYKISPDNLGFSDDLIKYLVAALDHLNDLFDFTTADGYALGQIIVWNAVLETGNQGFAGEYREDNTIVKVEGYGDWYTEEYRNTIDTILNGTIDVLNIYATKLTDGHTGTYISDIRFLIGIGEGMLTNWWDPDNPYYSDNILPKDQQHQVFIVFSELTGAGDADIGDADDAGADDAGVDGAGDADIGDAGADDADDAGVDDVGDADVGDADTGVDDVGDTGTGDTDIGDAKLSGSESKTKNAASQVPYEAVKSNEFEKAKVGALSEPETPVNPKNPEVDTDAEDSASTDEDVIESAKSSMKNTGLPVGIIVLLISVLLIAIRIKK